MDPAWDDRRNVAFKTMHKPFWAGLISNIQNDPFSYMAIAWEVEWQHIWLQIKRLIMVFEE
jgi:hypothetical protein